jgi:hypothetical protein
VAHQVAHCRVTRRESPPFAGELEHVDRGEDDDPHDRMRGWNSHLQGFSSD